MKGHFAFMKGNWTDLIIDSYFIHPKHVLPYLTPDIELELIDGKAIVSLVAFSFTGVKFFGIKVPFHGEFGEINFRTYVKSKIDGTPGVLFLKEFAPKRMMALTAKYLYNEPFYYKNIVREKNGLGICYSLKDAKAIASVKKKSFRKKTAIETFLIDRSVAFVKKRNNTSKAYQIIRGPWKIFAEAAIKLDKRLWDLLPDGISKNLLEPLETVLVNGSAVKVYRAIVDRSILSVSTGCDREGLAVA